MRNSWSSSVMHPGCGDLVGASQGEICMMTRLGLQTRALLVVLSILVVLVLTSCGALGPGYALLATADVEQTGPRERNVLPGEPFEGCLGLPATVVGTQADDFLVGTSKNDVILALGGNDIVLGLDGSDVVCLGPGNDRIIAGSHNDFIDCGPGFDLVHGGQGTDTATKSCEFHVSTRKWRELSPMPTPRNEIATAELDGKTYVA